ncbi:MAG TPA: EAL domain-containing protein [Acidocella sp.]|nr:EAL domain-containing protein [Acidocella sp.]
MTIYAQKGLLEFSDVWSLAIEGSGTGIWDRDLVTNEIRYSSSWFNILGYDEHPALNHIEVSYSRVHPDDLAFVRRQLDDHFAGLTPIYEAEHRLRTKDGSYKWVLSRGRIIARAPDGSPLRMAGTTVDVTATRNLSLKLQEQTEALTAAQRLAKLGMWRWDVNAKCVYFSKETSDMLGRPDIAIVNIEEMQAMYHQQDAAKALAVFRQVVVMQAPATLEYRLLHPNGDEIYVLSHAEPVLGLDGRTQFVRGTTQNITSLRQIEAALRESEDHYRHMVELHPQIPWTAGPDGAVLEVGPQWYAITGMTPETSMPDGWITALHADDREWVEQAWTHVLQSAGRLDIEYRVRCTAGDYLWVRARAAPRRNPKGEVIRWYGTLEDVTDKKMAQERLRYTAEHDLLTGALNRAALFAKLGRLLAQRSDAPDLALLCLDLDYFKDINDSYGHPVGDELLKLTTSRIGSLLGPEDCLARSGGDEFMIMLARVKSASDVSAFAARIAGAMQTPFDIGGLSLPGSVSIGAAIASSAELEPTELYRKADTALYAAKTLARGSHLIFHSEMQRELEASRRLRVDLSTAIANRQLFLEFQPIFVCGSNQIAGVETLLRWKHPELGYIPPAQFIPLAEETGMIAAIGAWVLREATVAAMGFPQNVKISVNVSPRQFELDDVEALVAATLAETGFAAHRLKLEVTESVFIQRNSASINKLHALRAHGVAIVLDDFGSGYSSLSYLNNFQFDLIKIDGSFLANIQTTDDSQPIFEAIVAIARTLKIPVTAEGVETKMQLDYVERLGCNYVQGYFLARPMSLPALFDLFAREKPTPEISETNELPSNSINPG